MEEPVGAQYAILVVVHTLKERCRNLQQRVSALEEENVFLRKQSRTDNKESSIGEVDKLRIQVAELNERNQQMQHKVKVVINENQELWCKLGKLTHANENLGNHLNKISDSIVQYTEKNRSPQCPLIRSRTFTQDEPHTKVLQKNLEENNRITSELEEVSLKILNSMVQGKHDLDSLYKELSEAHRNDHMITESYGYYYDDFDSSILEDFNSIMKELKDTKEVVLQQNTALHLTLDKVKKLQEIKLKPVKKIEAMDSSTQCDLIEATTQSSNTGSSPDSIYYEVSEEVEKICPMCCKNFSDEDDFSVYQIHVESHFVTADSFEIV